MLEQLEKRWPIADRSKIQLFSLNTPNGNKVSTALEELSLPYEPHLVNILTGDQFTEEFSAISPNSKIPVIVDPDGPGGKPMAIMESGAILLHLAEKTGKLLPADPAARLECLQWLLFQVGHIGPMFGQLGHFYRYAGDKCDHPYPKQRYATETRRLLGVLDRRLDGRAHLMGDEYTIADIATFPWVVTLSELYEAGDELELDSFEHVQRWLDRCEERPAFVRARDVCPLPK